MYYYIETNIDKGANMYRGTESVEFQLSERYAAFVSFYIGSYIDLENPVIDFQLLSVVDIETEEPTLFEYMLPFRRIDLSTELEKHVEHYISKYYNEILVEVADQETLDAMESKLKEERKYL